MADPEIKPRVTVIAKCDCPDCNREAFVKTDKNGRAYFTCRWPDLETGLACGATRKFSQSATNVLVSKFKQNALKLRKPDDDKEEAPKPATDKPADAKGGFLFG